MTTLTDLSPEILHNLFCFVQATDLASLSKTCHFTKDFIARDDLLWKRIYLQKFDAPRHPPSDSWAQALQNLILTEKLLESTDHDLKRSQTPFLTSQILPLVLSTTSSSTPFNTAFLTHHFHHASRRSNASTLLRQSSLFRRCGLPFDEPASTIASRQASARLHVYSSLPLDLRASELLDVPGAVEIHPYARSRLYDLRRYKATNFWGPFMDDGSGRVDWEKVQCIFIVLGFGLRMLCERSGGVVSGGSVGWGGEGGEWDGLAAGSYKSLSTTERSRDEDEQSNAATAGSDRGTSADKEEEKGAQDESDGVPSLETFMLRHENPKEARFQHEQAVFAAQDPYGVKGTWMRIVNFLDYHDLFAFNFTGHTPPEGVEREPVNTAEAFRLILLNLWVTKIEWPDEDADEDADEWETVDGSQASSSQKSLPAEQTGEAHEQVNGEGSGSSSGSGGSPESSGSASTTKEKEKKKSRYPIVHFAGRSRSLHIQWDPNARSHIRGHVRAYPSPPAPAHESIPNLPDPSSNLSHIYPSSQSTSPTIPTPTSVPAFPLPPEDDLVIRWTTFSVFHGEERWRSEGVQIGGLKSARGILGNWFDKDYDPHGPAGPTGFWKLSDRVEMYSQGRGLRGWGADDSD